MKRYILLALCLLLAFYVGWPLWSAYKIHSALEANDAKTLETKVDFPSVRVSLKPSVTAEVERALERAAGGVAGQLLGGALKQQLAPQLVDTIVNTVITPQRIGDFYQRRGDIKDILAERMARRRERGDGGGATGAATETQSAGTGGGGTEKAGAGTTPRVKMGWRNLKRLSFSGPLGFEIGVARDAGAAGPDIVAQLGFQGFDWKLVGLIPRAR
jgi:Protein of unknown function (DUF2939)